MNFAAAYWIIMLIWLVVGAWSSYPLQGPPRALAPGVILYILLVILGWKVFGAPLHP